MTSATRYQAVPGASNMIRRKSLAVSAVTSDNDTNVPAATAVSSVHQLSPWRANANSPENQALLGPSYPTSKKGSNPEINFVDEVDITASVLASNDGRPSKEPRAPLSEKIVPNFDQLASLGYHILFDSLFCLPSLPSP